MIEDTGETAAVADRINRGIFSSNTELWSTPQRLYDALHQEFGFTLDPCATPENAKCDRYFTIEDDGLSRPWRGVVFMNPPYGRGIGDWVAKAHKESLSGATVVCLVPARTDTAWWHDHAMLAHEIRLIRGRLHFGGDHERTAHNAPFPSAVVIFHPFGRIFSATSLTAMGRDGSGALHEHSWRVEGDGEYEPFHDVCEDCGDHRYSPRDIEARSEFGSDAR